jgi:lysozyme family protein
LFLLERFKEIFQHTLKWEGGEKLHNVAGDAGGWTKYGIAYNYNKKHFKDLEDFKSMKYDKACEIAFENYCKPLPLELIPEDCQALVFDIAFNSGIKKAIQLVQRALNLVDDGVCGPKTKAALKNLDKGELADERDKFYNAIVASNQTQKKFLKGWLNRSDYFRDTEI